MSYASLHRVPASTQPTVRQPAFLGSEAVVVSSVVAMYNPAGIGWAAPAVTG